MKPLFALGLPRVACGVGREVRRTGRALYFSCCSYPILLVKQKKTLILLLVGAFVDINIY